MFAITYWSVALSFPLIELSISMENGSQVNLGILVQGLLQFPQGDAVEL